MKIIILVAVLIAGTFAYACCMAAHTADEDAERLYQDYLKYKRQKEEERKE